MEYGGNGEKKVEILFSFPSILVRTFISLILPFFCVSFHEEKRGEEKSLGAESGKRAKRGSGRSIPSNLSASGIIRGSPGVHLLRTHKDGPMKGMANRFVESLHGFSSFAAISIPFPLMKVLLLVSFTCSLCSHRLALLFSIPCSPSASSLLSSPRSPSDLDRRGMKANAEDDPPDELGMATIKLDEREDKRNGKRKRVSDREIKGIKEFGSTWNRW